MSDLTAATIQTPDAFRHNGNGSSHFRSYLHGGGPCLNPAQGCEPVWFTTEPPLAARLAAPRDQTEDGLAERVRALVASVRTRHYSWTPPDQDTTHPADYCVECGTVWPCPEEADLRALLADQPDTTAGERVRDWRDWPHEFVEDTDDGSMCICGVPALTHDAAMERLADQPDTTASEEDQR